MIKNIKILALASLVFVACEKEETIVVNNSSNGEVLTAGTADFTKYVAIGNSLSAGYSDGALFKEGQKTSWTKILSEQFALVGGGEYKVPYMSDNIGGFSNGTVQLTQEPYGLFQRRYFRANACGPDLVEGVTGTILGASIALAGPYNNAGIPGAKCIDIVKPGFGMLNPYFGRISTAPSSQTVLDYAKSQSPTFFSVWIGNNDVLGYALAGADSSLAQITPTAGASGVGFEESYKKIIDDMIASGAKGGVVANIPYVTTIPMFTTVPFKPLAPHKFAQDANEVDCSKTYPPSPADIGNINAVNDGLLIPLKSILALNGITDRIELLSPMAANPLLIKDESLDNKGAEIITTINTIEAFAALRPLANYLGAVYGQARHTRSTDLIPLTTAGAIASPATLPPTIPASLGLGSRGVTYPMEDRFILVPSEILELKNATDNFNSYIKQTAITNKLAFVDANAVLTLVATTGISANGFTVKSNFVTGGGFSLDGVHPSPRGYALLANEFIKSINTTYGSNLKAVDLSKYRTLFPRVL